MGYLPSEFVYCGKRINADNANYKELILWLNKNKSGWVSSYASFAPSQVYYSPSFKVNIMPGRVVVAYKTADSYPQYVKNIKDRLGANCQ